MRHILKLCVSILLVIVIVFSHVTVVFSTDDVDINVIISDTAEYILRTVTNPGIGQTGGDWAMIALMRSGAPVPDSYVRSYYNRAAEQITSADGVLSAVKYSEYSRVALAMAAIGADPRDVAGYDLIEPLMDVKTTMFQGINGPILRS